ncbi:bacteriocin [Helicobacter pullorum NCTC 12824]|uniref:bacteriocin n=1 Tax=Helicobacter pullorum TaxID=35818 RepID=UPI0012467150|nr:bacteriocin [Helicobacter pullorum]KAB0574898.1 bacteriocin [Helicobacter pullorum NCTC 12824]
MKKLLLTLSVIAGLLSNAFAIDLISVATNGKSNENSLGIKTLNNQEMSEIVGGMTLKHNFLSNMEL